MITKESIQNLYRDMASGNIHHFAVPKDVTRFTQERAQQVSLSKCKGFTDELTRGIEEYKKSFLKKECLLNRDTELLAISDMICNAVSRPYFDNFQIVIHSGLFRLMSYRLIVGQMVTDIISRCRKLASADEHINELLNLSYLFGFWIYSNSYTYDLSIVVESLNTHNRTNYLHALGGAMLFIYLHEYGHIELRHHDEFNDRGNPSQERIALMEYEADRFAIDSVHDHLKAAMVVNAYLVFDMINEFELYALNSTDGHPLTYRRLEQLNSLLDPARDGDIAKTIRKEVTTSAERHHKSPYSDTISGVIKANINERRKVFSDLLPPIDECERGFRTLCEVYGNIQS